MAETVRLIGQLLEYFVPVFHPLCGRYIVTHHCHSLLSIILHCTCETYMSMQTLPCEYVVFRNSGFSRTLKSELRQTSRLVVEHENYRRFFLYQAAKKSCSRMCLIYFTSHFLRRIYCKY